MDENNIKKHPAYQYALDVQNGNVIANKDIKIVTKRFIDEINMGDKAPYYFDTESLKRIDFFLKRMNMATGPAKGKIIFSSLVGFQWFFIVNIFCWRHKDDHKRRRYVNATLLIARKSSKTFLSSLIFVLLLLLEPKYSQFYSVAPDRELSGMLKRQMDILIDNSPKIRNYFAVTNRKIVCIPKKSTYEPLANSNNRLDGREPNVFLCDETGALKNNYPLEAMRSGQQFIVNPLGIVISTAYPTLDNPMTEEVGIAEDKIQDGDKYDPTYFAMIYRPDEPKKWADNENECLKVNPMAQEIDIVKHSVLKAWKDAVLYKPKRPNFLTKTMNIFIDGDAGEQFITEEQIDACELREDYDWYGADVMVGLDFAQSNDNFGVAMIAYDADHDKFVAKSWSFYPSNKEEAKSKKESVNYADLASKGWAIPAGENIVDYGEVERFVMDLPDKYGVNIKNIGYDKWNAMSSVAKLESEGGFECIDVPQGVQSYPATKLLRESIQSDRFAFDKNDFYKRNFTNAKMVTNAELSYFLNKKKSSGKIDMVAATVDAMTLWQHENIEDLMYSNTNAYVI